MPAAARRAESAAAAVCPAAVRAAARSLVAPVRLRRRSASAAAASRSTARSSCSRRTAVALTELSDRRSLSASDAAAVVRREAASFWAASACSATSTTVAARVAASSSFLRGGDLVFPSGRRQSRPVPRGRAPRGARRRRGRCCSRSCAWSRADSDVEACAAGLAGRHRELGAALGKVVGGVGLGLSQRLGALCRDARGLVAEALGGVLERQFDRRVVAGVEERAQDLLALLRVGLEQLLEAPLGKHDDLAELLGTKAEELLGLRADLRPAGGERPAVLGGRSIAGVAQPPERRRLVVAGRPFSLELGALLLRFALDAIQILAEREVEDHTGEQLGIGVVAAHGSAGAAALALWSAAGDAVEGEGHRVEDGGLAGAGGAGDEEEAGPAQVGEVERLFARVGTEGLHRDAERPQGASSRRRRSSRSTTSAKAERRSSPRSSSVAYWKKASKSSTSLTEPGRGRRGPSTPTRS